MAKDPAFLFYSSDFLTGTMLMNNEQVGKYIRLLCLQHQKGHLSEKDMLNICISYDEDIYAKFAKDSDGKFYNVRCEEEISKRKRYSESRSNNRKGSENETVKPKKKPKQKNNHMSNISKTYVQHMENEIENENVIKNKTELEIAFESWVKMRKGMKGGITDHAIELGKSELKKLSEGDEQTAIDIINQSILNSWKGFFPLNKENAKQSIRKGQPDTTAIREWAKSVTNGEDNPFR